ncbi:MAG: tetratricopeptide repeat protein [Akkermansiaceae bacterium]|nr:tetratricopeptide repeat protein [Akkermansiaceae bacterium]MCP5544630.1 tetratricopeptide repeat protein [Akkermansiaceae bacterium]
MNRTFLAVSLAILLAPVSGAVEEPDWANIGKKAPEGLLEMAGTKQGALIVITPETRQGQTPDRMHLGFFISSDGLALCPLEPLCRSQPPEFLSADRVQLRTPAVLGIFEDEELALVKFKHKPKTALVLSARPPALGSWVSFVPTPFLPRKIAGPILAYRRNMFTSRLKVQREPIKHFSIAVSGVYSQQPAWVQGPLLDGKGEVVAVGSHTLPLPEQTYVCASSTAGFSERVKAAVEADVEIEVPIPMADQPYDPVVNSEEYMNANRAVFSRDFATARKLARAAVEKFPDSRHAKYWELMMAAEHWPEPKELNKLLEDLKLPEDVPAWQRSGHCYMLAEIAVRQGAKEEETIALLKKSDELYPELMACANLGRMFSKLGRFKEAESCMRRAVTYEPDRIAYWDELQKILDAQRKFKEADEVQDRVYLLESLF